MVFMIYFIFYKQIYCERVANAGLMLTTFIRKNINYPGTAPVY